MIFRIGITSRTGHLRPPNPVTAKDLVTYAGSSRLDDYFIDEYLGLGAEQRQRGRSGAAPSAGELSLLLVYYLERSARIDNRLNRYSAEEINVKRVNRKYQQDKYGVYAENGSTKWSALLALERETERLGQITRVLQGIVDFLPHFADSLSTGN
ncbi:MAG: hypothetical protein Q9211_003763 [Gyalolechia sp. 1 TL-2023]